MSALFCLALLALSSLAAASDPGCGELLKPLEVRSQISGKWIFHAGASDNEKSMKDLKTMESSWIELSPLPESDDMTLSWGDKVKDGKCYYGSVNSTLAGNATRVTYSYNFSGHEHVGKNLMTCAECLLWTDNSEAAENGETRHSRNLYIFTKSGQLDDSDLEVFRKQAACLNFPAEFHFGKLTDLCPAEKEAAADVEEEQQ
ncbi:Hypothetical protein SMAX5B_010835 [Scophthalmus maximus]|uniref:Apolipoprotein M n=2 Tax=Scophthalmus maximus TaxID=52904 RepID=A0A2U9BTK7_SCOMX|nr:Hypothetical protein SMAX5B_010835 [Scophthalmus maximus]